MGFRADGDENVYVYLESKSGSAIAGVDAADNNRFKISASTTIGLNPDTASPMLVLDPRTGGTVGEGDITLLPKGSAGSGNVSIDSGGLVVASLSAGVAQTNSLGKFSSTNGSNGQVLIGGGSAPAWANLTAGTNISVSSGANTITISGTGAAGFTWVSTAGGTASVNTGYIANNGASLTTVTLPSTAAVGDRVRMAGNSSGGWKVAQNSGQTIYVSGSNTTTGVGGSLASTTRYDAVELLCITANTDWAALSVQGNLTIV
jgi:hypothetical protein